MKREIKLKILDWWDNGTGENFKNNAILQILKKHLGDKYEFIEADKPEFILYGPFGDEHLNYPSSCVRIFFSGENIRADFNLADYAIDFDLLDFGERHLCYPLYIFYKDDFMKAINKHRLEPKSRDRFCCFLVSNPYASSMRDEIFDIISSYKRVDSGGKYRNNIGGEIPNVSGDFSSAKREWLGHYKFNICSENSSHKGYVTEKIIQSFSSGCIPIYFGDSLISDELYSKYRLVINPKAFINVHSFSNLDEMLEEVKRIDNDESAYFAMLREPAFLQNDYLGYNPNGGGGRQCRAAK